jgi:hypothetical protein
MAAWTAAARQAINIGRLSTPKSTSLVHRRGMAGSAGIFPIHSIFRKGFFVFNPIYSS